MKMGSAHRRADVVASLLIGLALLIVAVVHVPGRASAGDYGEYGDDGDRAVPDVVAASSGIYVAEQAEAGALAFASHCAACHGAGLEGGFGPPLAPLDPWQFGDAPLTRLFDRMRLEMPFDAPGSLDIDTYLVILTFVLRENGYPSGAMPLESAEEVIARVVLDDPPALPAE